MSEVIVALDYSDTSSLLNFTSKLDPSKCKVKIGFDVKQSNPVIIPVAHNLPQHRYCKANTKNDQEGTVDWSEQIGFKFLI